MTMFVAPTEPPKFRELGATSSEPEKYGVDFLWQSQLGLVGVQRKQFPDDFLASVHDGRLNREYGMMRELDLAVLMLEGKAHFTSDGNLIRARNGKRTGWTRTQHRNYLSSVQLRGIQVCWTETITDSVSYLRDMQLWTDKDGHDSLDQRPSAKGTSKWGEVTDTDYLCHLLQSFDGIGPKQARAIVQHLGNPLALVVTKEDLMSVPGIGKGRAEKIVKVFNAKHPVKPKM